jgi:hypothetical protein
MLSFAAPAIPATTAGIDQRRGTGVRNQGSGRMSVSTEALVREHPPVGW